MSGSSSMLYQYLFLLLVAVHLSQSTCLHKGKSYAYRSQMTINCRNCTCERNGRIGCKGFTCEEASKSCQFVGGNINHGQVRIIQCRMCKCTNGKVDCQQRLRYCKRNAQTCIYRYRMYRNLASVRHVCNTCICSNGRWECGTKQCYPDKKTCVRHGKTYSHKEPYVDGCRNCQCNNGRWKCKTPYKCGAFAKKCAHNLTVFANLDLRKDQCNLCRCQSNGTWDCSQKVCDVFLPDTKPLCRYNSEVYKPGQRITMKEAGRCTCQNGNWSCASRSCKDGSKTLKHGQKIKKDCNTCVCNGGRLQCTTKKCVKNECVDNGKTYKAGLTIKKDCNKCTCLGKNRWHCTKRTCTSVAPPVLKPNKECTYSRRSYKIGRYFRNYCSICFCQRAGWRCRLIRCSSRHQKRENKRCTYQGKTYKPDTTIKQDCNTCRCIKGNWGCTRMACPP